MSFKLKSGVSTWWDQVQTNRWLIGKQLIKSWPRMCKMMKERFLSANYEQILYQQYQSVDKEIEG